MQDVSPKLLEDAQNQLIEMSGTWKASVTRGIALDLVGNVIAGKSADGYYFSACHAWVGTTFRLRNKDNFLILSCHSKVRSKGICSVEAHEAIILWMASDDCPFSKYVLNRGDKDSLLNGGIVIYCGKDGASENQALWMCKVLRYGVEGSQALDVWYYLYQNGVNALLALYIATYVRTVHGATFGYTGPEGHSAVFSGGYWGSYRAGATAKDCLIGKPYDKPANTTEVFWSGKDSKGGAKEANIIKGFTAPMKKSDGWGGTVNAQGSGKETFLARVLEWQEKLQAEIDDEKGIVEKVVARLKKPSKDSVYLEMDL